ncbi:30S ribosomal protein S15 [Patescibacteria group bacterium]|nr:30S ribosomal protein S15 [Patescibacteria group bacterium]
MLEKKQKDKIIATNATHKGDTGSPEVQIAILTAEIEDLAKHLKKHDKDHSSRRGLLGKVAQRKKIQMYLKKEDQERYQKLMKKLGLKVA